jgi:hypothetical protein
MPSSFTETGSAHLHRKTFFNSGKELDLDIPDGDVDVGKQVYNVHCVGYRFPDEDVTFCLRIRSSVRSFTTFSGKQLPHKENSPVIPSD